MGATATRRCCLRPNRYVALELSLGRFSMTAEGNLYGVAVRTKQEVVVYPVLATVKLVLPLGKLELFGLAGGGLYLISSKVHSSAPGLGSASGTTADEPFGVHVGGGLNIWLSPMVQLGAEVKYISGSTTLFDIERRFDSLIVGGALTIIP